MEAAAEFPANHIWLFDPNLHGRRPRDIDKRPSFTTTYVLPFLYAAFTASATLLHRSLTRHINIIHFLIAAYNTIIAFMSFMVFVFRNQGTTISIAPAMHYNSTHAATRRWKPFAFVLLYLLSEQAYWLSLRMLHFKDHQSLQMVYPLFVMLAADQWYPPTRADVPAELRRRPGGDGEGQWRWKLPVLVGLVNLTILVRMMLDKKHAITFEFCYGLAGVALLAARDVVAGDVLGSMYADVDGLLEGQDGLVEREGKSLVAEMMLMGSTLVSVQELVMCWNSGEYGSVWREAVRGLDECCVVGFAVVGVLWGLKWMVGMEMLRRRGRAMETVEGWGSVVAAAGLALVGREWFGI